MAPNIENSPKAWQADTSNQESSTELSYRSPDHLNGSKNRDSSQSSLNEESNTYDGDSKNDQIKGRGKNKRPSKGRVFQCTGYPDCNMSFTRSEHLARHKRKHTGEKPFTCPHCSKNFSRLDNLRQHKQTVHAFENYMIDNSLKKDGQENVLIKNPETPGPDFFTMRNKEVSTPNSLISPPNSRSPRYNHSVQNRHRENSHTPYDQLPNPTHILPVPTATTTPHPPPHQHTLPQTKLLKVPSNQSKAKRRPQPLSLSHSFIHNNNSSIELAYGGSLKTAPLVSMPPTTSSPSSFHKLHYLPPKSASLIPKMVSPLSPLFHQSFNQVNGVKSVTPHDKLHSNHESHLSSNLSNNLYDKRQSANKSNLPSISHKNGSPSQNISRVTDAQSFAKESCSDKSVKEDSTKNWLRGVLNEERNTSSNAKITQANGDESKQKENSKHFFYSSKPSIDKLLSPYDNDQFSDSDKT